MDNSILYPIFFCFSKSVAFMIIFFEYFFFWIYHQALLYMDAICYHHASQVK